MPKAIAPNATKAKVDTKASATVGEPSTSASSSPVERQQHHPLSLAVRGRQTMEKIVTALMIINGACFRTYNDDVVEDTGLDWLQEMAA